MKKLRNWRSIYILRRVIVQFVMFAFILAYAHPVYAADDMSEPVEVFGENKEQEELEHLLFAKLVYDYLDGYEGKTVQEYVNDNIDLYSDEIWDSSGITYESLYNMMIGDWEIYCVCNRNDTSGFYGAAFKKEDKVIIALRGSEMFTEEFALDESNDWVGTDFKFALFNELSLQFEDADSFYRMVICCLAMDGIQENTVDITITGHSLGGALCAYESLITGKFGYSFDGACGHIIDLTYYYGYLDIDDFSGTDDLDNIPFVNYTDTTGYDVADLIQHTYADYMYQVDRETNLENLNEYTLIPKTADAGSHIIWSTLKAEDGMVTFTDKVDVGANGFTYEPYGPVYLDITKNVIEAGMENVNFDTPWNIIDYENIDYNELAGSLTGIVKNGRVVLASSQGGVVTAYDNVGVNSAFDLDTVMYGGKGDDHLIGYVADDVLIAGTGTDILDGNLGNDTYIIDKNPDKVTTIRDISGEKTTIILRNTSVTKLDKINVDGSGLLELGDNQYIDLDIATKAENVEIYTYNNGNLRNIGTLKDLGSDKVSRIYKDDYCTAYSEWGNNVVFLDGTGSINVYSHDMTTCDTITNDIDHSSDIEDACDSTVTVAEYDWGLAYVDTSLVNPSVFIIMSDGTLDMGSTVVVDTTERCDLAVGVIDENNSFLGCDRKYNIRFRDYEVRFELVSEYGSQQGEVDWVDAIVGGINILEQWLGN